MEQVRGGGPEEHDHLESGVEGQVLLGGRIGPGGLECFMDVERIEVRNVFSSSEGVGATASFLGWGLWGGSKMRKDDDHMEGLVVPELD